MPLLQQPDYEQQCGMYSKYGVRNRTVAVRICTQLAEVVNISY
ncbi:hypothetical protein [Pontibacter sp. 172403-2]|nr:hypothetical protein [Pontibacter sp. 172403-2]